MKLNSNLLYILISGSLILSSCTDDTIDKVNSPIDKYSIGGYQSSDEVAKENLVTKLTFDGDLSDNGSTLTKSSATNVAYADGVKGKAWDGSSTQERYAVLDATSKLISMSSFTFSFWMNTANTVPDGGSPGQGKGAQGIFSIVRPTEFWGSINLFLENPDSTNPERLRFKLGIENERTGVAWKAQGAILNIDGQISKWVYVTISYNASTSKVTGYINGVKSTLFNTPYAPKEGIAGGTTLYADNPGSVNNSANAPLYGDFEMKTANGKVVFGTHQFETTPPLNNGSQQDWATSFAGKIDEFRIYNKALTDSEVNAIYTLEKQGQ